MAVALGLSVMVLMLGGGVYVGTQRSRTTRVSLAEALAHYHRSFDPRAPVGSARVADSGAAAQSLAGPGAAAVQTPVPGASPRLGSPASKAQGVAPVSGALAFTTPASGVYSYDTTGGESISIFGAHHDYPAVSYATIHTSDGGRWQVEWFVIKEHVDHYAFQGVMGQDLELSQGRDVTFFGQTDGATLYADPPQIQVDIHAAPGSATDARLRDSSGSSARDHVTFIGREQVNIGGTVVNAYHFTLDSVVHGKAEGTEHSDVWVHPDTGLVLRLRRNLDTYAHAVFGNVHYLEHATFSLRSLTPAT